jgi:endo-1,4-beta-xylanase
MKNNQFFSKTVLSCSAAFMLLFASCSQVTSDEQSVSPQKPSSAKVSTVVGQDRTDFNNLGSFFATVYKDGGYCDFNPGTSANGNFSISYNSNNDIVGGKGWRSGTPTRNIGYNVGSLTGSRDFVGVYGWSHSNAQNNLIEYYICEFGSIPASTYVNNVSSDGHTYNFYRNQRVNAPSIEGTKTFWQYIDRWGGASTGTNRSISMATHINNWKSKGVYGFTDNLDYQVFGLEAFGNKSGYINATVW